MIKVSCITADSSNVLFSILTPATGSRNTSVNGQDFIMFAFNCRTQRLACVVRQRRIK